MPDIDVSDLCDDPDIAGEAFTVIRRQQVMQTNGTPSITTDMLDADGSITPTGDNSLVRAEAYSQQQNSILVITRFRLRGASKDADGNEFLPDIIQTADGNTFIVKSLNEWTSFGGGFVAAECVSFDFSPRPPT